jgi:hypothetical protein
MMPSHEHRWVYAGDVAIPTKDEILGDPFNRLEYCIECGAFRIQFGSRWRYWYSDVTKQFLNQFNREIHTVLKVPPAEFKLGPPVRGANRLGRGLKDISATPVGGTGWKGMFHPVKKGN